MINMVTSETPEVGTTGRTEEVEFHIDGKQLVIEKAEKLPKFTHQDLLKSLRTAKKRLVDLGAPRGEEVL